jgi:IclR family transcriptional regulator, KDG regulon repressor
LSADQPRRFLQSVNMALDIIDEVSKARRPIGITEIADLLGLSKGAVHTVLANLEARGYVLRSPDSLGFTLGQRAWELGIQASQVFDIGAIVGPEMKHLAEHTGETTQLVSFSPPNEILFLSRVLSPHPVQILIPLGARAPASTTASGLLFLAAQPASQVYKLLSKQLPKLTDHSIVDIKILMKTLDRVREMDYALVDGLYYPDALAIATPIRDTFGNIPYAISVYAPNYRFNRERALSFVPELKNSARQMEQKLFGKKPSDLPPVPKSSHTTRSRGADPKRIPR